MAKLSERNETLTPPNADDLIHVVQGGVSYKMKYSTFVESIDTQLTALNALVATNTVKRSYPVSDETKLAGIEDNATADQDLSPYALTASLSAVGLSGDYNDLSNKPDLSIYDNLDEYADFASFPVTGESEVFYVAEDTGSLYRWTGSAYVQISGDLALGEISSTAYRGDRGKTAYDHTFNGDNPHNVTKAQIGLGSVDNTSDTNKPISSAQASKNASQDALIATNTAKVSATGNELEESDIDTLSKLNAVLTDSTLINTTDSRLSDARTPTTHNHNDLYYTESEVDALLHSPVTVSDTAEIDLILSGQHISANLKSGSIDVLRLDAGVQYSLGLADSAIQSGDLATVATSGDYNDLSNKPDLSVYDSFDQYADLASFPATGDADVVYVAQDTGYLYRWTGSTYAQMSAELALGETASTAYRGDRGKTAFDHTSLTNNPHNVTKTQVGLSNVPNTDATARSSHTGTQTASTISDFDTQVESNINTLAKLNAIIADATLIDTTDSRLSDARTPTAHTHTESDISDLGNYLENLIEDLTPQLGGDLECEDHDITNVSRITSSSTTTYTGKGDAEGTFQQTGSVDITGGDGFAPPLGLGGATARSTVLANKTLNFTNGTEYFGSGFLFWNKSIIQSQAGSYFGGMYALASQPVFDLQGTHSPVMPFNYEILSSPTYIVSGTGALTILDVANLSAKQTFGADVNVTRYFGIDLGLPTGTANGVRGTLTNYIGYKTPNFDQVETAGNSVLRPTNGTHVLLGTSTPPSGYWNIYQADANVLPNRWNAAHQYGYKSISSATTMDGTYDRIELIGTSTYTITLPTAVGIAGREYTFVKSGASGTITIDGDGSETINGTTTKTLTTQYDVLTVISNGSNWLIID